MKRITAVQYLDPLGLINQLVLRPHDIRSGLEIECGKGIRVLAGRTRGTFMYGIDAEDHSSIWKTIYLEFYCRQADPRDIFYKDNTFDYVVWPDFIKYEKEEDIDQALKEAHRVGSFRSVFNCPLSPERNMSWWMDKFLSLDYYIEIANKSMNSGFLIEAIKV